VVPDEEELGQDYWQNLFARNQKTTAAPSTFPTSSLPTIIPSLPPETSNADPMAYATPTNLTDSDSGPGGIDIGLPFLLTPSVIGASVAGLTIFCLCCCLLFCLIFESLFIDDETKTIYVDTPVGEVYDPQVQELETFDQEAVQEAVTPGAPNSPPAPNPSSPTGYSGYPPHGPGYWPPGPPPGHFPPGYYPPPGYYGHGPPGHWPPGHQRGRGRGRGGKGRPPGHHQRGRGGKLSRPPGHQQRGRAHSNRTKDNPAQPRAENVPHRQKTGRSGSEIRAQQGKNRAAQRKKSNRTTTNNSPPGNQPRNQKPREAITPQLKDTPSNTQPTRGNNARGPQTPQNRANTARSPPKSQVPRVLPLPKTRNSLANRKNSTRRVNQQGGRQNCLQQPKQPANGAPNRPGSMRASNHKNSVRPSANRQLGPGPPNKQNGLAKKSSNGNKPVAHRPNNSGNKSNPASNRQTGAGPGTPKLGAGPSMRANGKNMKMPNKSPLLSKKNSSSQAGRLHGRAQQQNRRKDGGEMKKAKTWGDGTRRRSALIIVRKGQNHSQINRRTDAGGDMKKAKTAGDGVRARAANNRREGRAHSQITRPPQKNEGGRGPLRLYE